MLEKFKQTKFYKGLQRLREDMRPMSFWKKIDHLWYCYKIYIITIVVFGSILGIILGSFISERSKEYLVRGMLINLYVDPVGMSYLSSDYEDYLNAEKNQVVSLEYTHFGDLDDPATGDDAYNRALVVIARVEGKLLDYMILDKPALETYILYDVYADLREFFTEEELAQMEAEKRVIYAQIEGEEERWPIAVKITDIPFVKDNVKNEGDIYFALPGHEPNMEMSRNAWEYLNAWESTAE